MARPRSIPESEALEQALMVFWEKGYDRASIADLGEAIGVGPSSIYNAFGSKAELFERVLAHYGKTYADFVPQVVAEAEQRGAAWGVRELLRRAVTVYTTKDLPGGCAMLQGGGSGGSNDSEGGRIAREARLELERALYRLLAQSLSDEKLAAPPKLLAKFLLGTMRGLSQLACDGASRRDLFKLADHAAQSCLLCNAEVEGTRKVAPSAKSK